MSPPTATHPHPAAPALPHPRSMPALGNVGPIHAVRAFLWRHERLRNSLAGGAAGAGASFLTCPLDVVKTRLQHSPKYAGTLHGLRTIWTEEGYRGWYRGLNATMLGYLPSWAIYFTVYEETKRLLYAFSDGYPQEIDGHRDGSSHGNAPALATAVGAAPATRADDAPPTQGRLSPGTVNVLSAMAAGVISTTATNPLWVVKSRFMTQSEHTTYNYRSIWHAFYQIYTHEGVRGFYKGLGTSLLGVSHAAVQFPLYERIKYILHFKSLAQFHENVHQREKVATHHILAASVLSKMVASMITYPHEVIRTRLQVQTHPIRYHSIRHCVRVVLHEEGPRAFYRGLGTNLFRTLPNSAITLFTYERLAKLLEVWSQVDP
ncbi:hypothetical protein GGF32_007969 [Allomyces javanicus]|nr:hypothetical protein GGF32_007969 [Allomyces javanicus]